MPDASLPGPDDPQMPDLSELPDMATLERDVEREAARVGVDWTAAAPALRTLAQAGPSETTDEGFEVVLSLDVAAMLATLRALPDGAGTDAFLAEFGRRAGG